MTNFGWEEGEIHVGLKGRVCQIESKQVIICAKGIQHIGKAKCDEEHAFPSLEHGCRGWVLETKARAKV